MFARAAQQRADRRGHEPPARADEHEHVVARLPRGEHGDHAERRRRAGAQHHRRSQEVDEPHSGREHGEQSADAGGAVDEQVGALRELRRRLVGGARRCTARSSARPRRAARAAPRTRRGRSGRRRRRALRRGRAPSSSRATPRPLSSAHAAGGSRAPCGPRWVQKPAASAAASPTAITAASAAASSGAPRQCNAAIACLSSRRTRRRCSSSVIAPRANSCTRCAQLSISGSCSTVGRAAAQDLGAVVADVGDRPERDDPPRDRGLAARHAGDEPVALGDLDQLRPRRLRDVRVIGVADDRRQRAVDVEQDGGAAGLGAQRLQRLGERGGDGHATYDRRHAAEPNAEARRDRGRGRSLQRPVRRGRRDA